MCAGEVAAHVGVVMQHDVTYVQGWRLNRSTDLPLDVSVEEVICGVTVFSVVMRILRRWQGRKCKH
jgi:hypothetical protein